MKNKIFKEEALDFIQKNSKSKFRGYDDFKWFIKELYRLGATKVYVVAECESNIADLCDFVDALYIVVDKNISVDLAVFIAGIARADEVSYLKQHKAIRLWWD